MGWTLEPARWLAAGFLSLAYIGLCLWYGRRAAGRSSTQAAAAVAAEGQSWTVAYASQTGTAEAIARQTALALQRASLTVRCCPLNELGGDQLMAGGRFLFVVSTAGQGEAPDNGAGFAEMLEADDGALDGVDFALLALGDRDYPDFCGCGRRLEARLMARGARRCFDRIDMHRAEPKALANWQGRLAQLAGADEFADLPDDQFSPWRLVERQHLNPGSPGDGVYRLRFEASGQPLPRWESGDLAQITAPAEPGCPRNYSIASLPDEGGLQLLVRVRRNNDGTPGIASGWLTQGLAPGEEVALRLRPHYPFRLNGNHAGPLICIGSGVGLAGLRGHLAGRIAAGVKENWLLFGERSRAHDFYQQGDLERWLAAGQLERLDTVFSRDGEAFRYVQECLVAHADLFRGWVARGAAVYVCGSRAGMGDGVDRAIREILGADGYQCLVQGGRYCRDLF